MLQRQTFLVFAAIVASALVAGNPAFAVPMNLVDNDLTSVNAHYSVDKNANISVTYSSADVGSQQGTLTINTTWGAGDFGTRSILFQQTEVPAGDFDTIAGLRLQLVLSLGNNTGVPWDEFFIALGDTSVPATLGSQIGGEAAHLFKAHFHPNAGGISVAGGLTTPNFNNTTLIELDNGLSNTGLIVTNFFLHERNLTDGDADDHAVQRTFTLLLTPNAAPEPAPWMLLAMAGLMLLVQRNRRA